MKKKPLNNFYFLVSNEFFFETFLQNSLKSMKNHKEFNILLSANFDGEFHAYLHN